MVKVLKIVTGSPSDINSKLAGIGGSVYATGRVSATGIKSWSTGYNFSAYRIAEGRYRITHGVGNTNYILMITPIVTNEKGRSGVIQNITVSYTDIAIIAGGDVYRDHDFFIAIIKT